MEDNARGEGRIAGGEGRISTGRTRRSLLLRVCVTGGRTRRCLLPWVCLWWSATVAGHEPAAGGSESVMAVRARLKGFLGVQVCPIHRRPITSGILTTTGEVGEWLKPA